MTVWNIHSNNTPAILCALPHLVKLLLQKEEMQDHIKISIGYIEHLEANKFELLPLAIYVKGFMRSYLRFLGVEEYDRLVKTYLERMKDWQAKKKS